eukprot:3541635-Pleurochrysis_carterae.AAC.4
MRRLVVREKRKRGNKEGDKLEMVLNKGSTQADKGAREREGTAIKGIEAARAKASTWKNWPGKKMGEGAL